MRINLFHKMLLLALVPLVCAACFVSLIASIAQKTEFEAAKSERAGRINNLIGRLVQACYEGIRTVKIGDVIKTGEVPFQRNERIREAEKVVAELKVLLKENPKRIAALDKVLSSAKAASSVVDEAVEAFRRGDRDPDLEVRLRRKATDFTREMFPSEVYDMAAEQKAIENAGPGIQAELRSQLRQVLLYLFISLVLSIVAAWYVSHGLTKRIGNVSANSLRLARNQTLAPPLKGSDEIAQLDHTFHQVASLLAQAAQRERALIENASEIICSIDKSTRISSINAASAPVLGYEPEELWGKFFVDIVEPSLVKETLNQVDSLVAGLSSQPFEARLKSKSGRLVDVLISARWNEGEQSLFCVIHDTTAQKDAERMKQEVIAMVTHDLKTPLTTIRHVLELLEDGKGGALNSTGLQLLDRADSASLAMLTLISDLLELEKIEAGMLSLSKSDVDLQAVFEECRQVVAGLSERKSVPVEIRSTDMRVNVDADRLLQILSNLVSNAIKFSPAGRPVILEAEIAGAAAVVHVKDHGRGIPADLVDSVFNRFTQVKPADAKVQAGTGLGLAICKALVELHGGTIWANSVEGEGSTFSFQIPLSEPPLNK
jgi:PAS domain S-box-containing protein